MNSKCAILVLSCDKYASLWKPFFSQFHKYWPDCPYNVYLGSNIRPFTQDRKVKPVLSVIDKDWSSNTLEILKKIKEEYIFLWHEDYFLIKPIDTELFRHCFSFMKRVGANHIHTNDEIKPDRKTDDSLFGFYEKGMPYRISASGFWNNKHLQSMLLPGKPSKF